MAHTGISVLIIDDHPQVIGVVTRCLEASSVAMFNCGSADRLSAAKGMLADGGYDLIVLDSCLPDSRGFEGLLDLLKMFPDIPIVVLTGDGDAAAARRAIDYGAQSYEMKPILDYDGFARNLLAATVRHQREKRILAAAHHDIVTVTKKAFDWKKIAIATALLTAAAEVLKAVARLWL